MRFQPWMLLVAGTIAVIAATVFAAIAMGGEDTPAIADTTTPTGTTTAAAATPPATEDVYPGPAPEMTAHIHEVSPGHGQSILQRATVRSPQSNGGICAEVTYEGLPQNNLHFQVAVDGEIVTTDLTVEVVEGSQQDPIRGRMCYATPEGLSLGIHNAAVAVHDPSHLSGPPSELVSWKFDVVE